MITQQRRRRNVAAVLWCNVLRDSWHFQCRRGSWGYSTIRKNVCLQGHFSAAVNITGRAKRDRATPKDLQSKSFCVYYTTDFFFVIRQKYDMFFFLVNTLSCNISKPPFLRLRRFHKILHFRRPFPSSIPFCKNRDKTFFIFFQFSFPFPDDLWYNNLTNL